MNQPKDTVMVVEDDDELNEAIAHLLRDHGFDVLAFANGEDALRELQKGRPVRAILLDVMMPVMNGATFRGDPLADPALASIPLVPMPGRRDLGPLRAALRPAVCLQKPVTA